MTLPAQAGKGILRAMSQEDYLLANQPRVERCGCSRWWGSNGRQLLSKVGGGSGARALESAAEHGLASDPQRVGRPVRQVVGFDVDEHMLNPLVHSGGRGNAT